MTQTNPARTKPWPVRSPLVLVVAGLVLAASVVAVFFLPRSSPEEIASQATVTASSTDPLFSARDAVNSGSADVPGAGWVSDRQGVGAWIELTWPAVESLRQITVVRNPLDQPGATAGYLTFGDGSHLLLPLSATSRQTTVFVGPRDVDSVRFTASNVSGGATSVTISELTVTAVDQSTDAVEVVDLGPPQSITSSSGSGSSVQGSPVSESDPAGGEGFGTGWTAESGDDSWVQLNWNDPQELTSVQVTGAVESARTIRRGTLQFSDGSQLPLGAVTGDPTRPTTVSFMPRMTTSLRLVVEESDGRGALLLSGMRAYGRGATPLRHVTASSTPTHSNVVTTADCTDESTNPTPSRLEIRCPVMGSTVDGDVTFDVVAPEGYSSLRATIWPADAAAPEGATADVLLTRTGAGTVGFSRDDLPRGPFVVNFQAVGPGVPADDVNFQLYRAPATTAPVPSSAAATGRTLTFAEEFDGPISVSRTGAGAEFAAAKPVVGRAEDFGEAIFSDPERETNLRVVDDNYLRIDITPTEDGATDPQGWNRAYRGGLLASARVGGSGFAAQYGYFETRMAVPAAPGTWPAFWMLPSDNLVEDQAVVAEIDAVELYGHDPVSACHTTHQYEGVPDRTGVAECGQRFASVRQALEWHTYGVAILPDVNLYYIDGIQVASAPQVRGADSPMFFLVDLELGGGWPVELSGVQNRASLYIDYIRVYV